MRITTITALLLIGCLAPAARAADVQTATGEVTLESATDQVESILSADGEIPGRDVRSLRVASDGTQLMLTATLTAPASGTRAAQVVRMFVDTDDDATTGAAADFTDVSGFEFEIHLNLCVKYANGAIACAGTGGTKAAGYSATAGVKNTATGADVKHPFDLTQTPVEGAVVAAPVPYADLGVKAGQVVRFYAREGDGPMDAASYFPQVRLTLK